MIGYFTPAHFSLLREWKGQKRDSANPAQNQAYDELKKAYELTESWAEAIKARRFPTGRVRIRKGPTNQGNCFAEYHWAKIYPSPDAPRELAYTCGISADEGFYVDIDTVGLYDNDPLRQAFLKFKDSIGSSPLSARLPESQGLNMDLAALTDWAVAVIDAFSVRYEDVVTALKLDIPPDDEAILKRFDGKPAFRTFRQSWSLAVKTDFCRLARAAHAAGLDCWHIRRGINVRIGRKHPGNDRAAGVLCAIHGRRERKITWKRELGGIPVMRREPLTPALLARIEKALSENQDALNDWLPLEDERPGLWPDQLEEEPVDIDEEAEENAVPGDDADNDLPEEKEAAMTGTRRQPLNRIYYGPPGTGKTHELQKLLREHYTHEAAAMPPEQWKALRIGSDIAPLTWWEAVAATLYALGGKAKVSAIAAHPFIQAVATAKGRSTYVVQTIWSSLLQHTVREAAAVGEKVRLAPYIFEKSVDSVWSLAGEWREACAGLIRIVDEIQNGYARTGGEVRRYAIATFHQSYGYEEFVEGLRPVLDAESDTEQVRYEIRPGKFKTLCQRARMAPDQRFAMVIDEINRGNISKIFGELITLIETDKRDPMDGTAPPIEVELAYSGSRFSVPANVDIIGTMNTADRSLALVDTALRRRFDFVPRMPDTRNTPDAPLHDLTVTIDGRRIDIRRLLHRMNERIEVLYDREHTIGHAYFTSLAAIPDGAARFEALAQCFRYRIVPLLEEYFFEDWQKIRLVLADNQKRDDACFIHVESGRQNLEEELASLFGSDHGLDAYAAKRRFFVQDAAFHNPDAYLGIYANAAAN